ncbi:PLP-dependent aminotransferase family protein [Actinospica robiniae]|uniref:MocR-like pyridoxine biosynthesis transcription factor PdxR n=1 Tax=Actinospica robiniae TaxID=304901 RepID=UPI0004102189|nr:PLP-dependent aminotransferase family protein [Actinospica robiniae]
MESSDGGFWLEIAGGGGPGSRHRRLAHALREAVREQRLPPGSPLPPSRQLAADLGCSRWVVTEAYGQLIAEGYLEARTGSATRVRVLDTPAAPTPAVPVGTGVRPTALLDLTPGQPDLRSFPRRAWGAAVHRALTEAADADLGARPRGGHPRLRAVLADYLGRVRGAAALGPDVLVCRGIADAVSQICVALRERGIREIGVEEPCWAQVRQAAGAAGVACVPVPVDEHGIRADLLANARDGSHPYARLRAVAVTPAHQFPTGSVLAPQRRAALLRWAEAADGLVLEDDYDAEFRYDREPVGVLQGIAPARVALLGSVSKTLSPGLGLGWAVLPPAWLPRVLAGRSPTTPPPVVDQLALASFIESGGYDRHLRALRRRYRDRRAALIAAIRTALPQAEVSGADAGLHLVIRLPGPRGPDWSARLVRAAADRGLMLSPLDFFHSSGADVGRALVIGYGSLPDHAVVRAADLLRAAVVMAEH